MDWDAVAAEIKELREKIHRLGNVNLDAIGELDELEQRSNFLTTQVTDLTSSKLQLEQLINEINLESSVRFEQTFNLSASTSRACSASSSAAARPTSSSRPKSRTKGRKAARPRRQTLLPIMKKIDVLDAGIEVIARPPGKKAGQHQPS